MARIYQWSENFERSWGPLAERALKAAAPSVWRSRIMKLSDRFIEEAGNTTPWDSQETLLTYALYFHPLNYLRARRAIEKAYAVGFFEGIETFVDWGCGLGAAALALWDVLPMDVAKKISLYAVDHAPMALKEFRHHNYAGFSEVHYLTPQEFERDFKKPWTKTCLNLSYSYNELKNFNLLAHSPEGLLILEPSTHRLARRLQSFREKALEEGYKAWVPCTHQEKCPMLLHSKKDWCHDRLGVEQPPRWEAIHRNLPIKNKTLTLSYLGLRKTAPAPAPAMGVNVRLVGDELKEKGKVRWRACADSRQINLAWLKRQGKPPEWRRGELLNLPQELIRQNSGAEIKVPPETLREQKTRNAPHTTGQSES